MTKSRTRRAMAGLAGVDPYLGVNGRPAKAYAAHGANLLFMA
jgi:hypothetical protein